MSPQYYSVEDEHDIEVVEHVIGSGFVLAQTSITQAVTIVKRMYEDARCLAWIPKDKAVLLKTAAPIHPDTGFSKIAIINAAADYYKHRSEWKDEEWVESTKNKTIASSTQLGLGLKGYHQMEHALRELQIYNCDMSPIGGLIGDWREALADHLRAEGRNTALISAPANPKISTQRKKRQQHDQSSSRMTTCRSHRGEDARPHPCTCPKRHGTNGICRTARSVPEQNNRIGTSNVQNRVQSRGDVRNILKVN